jgi:hypothetical protein
MVGGGLIGMQERVHAYGGEVRAGPGQPGGWNVSARLRLDAGAGYCSQVADTARAGLRRGSV